MFVLISHEIKTRFEQIVSRFLEKNISGNATINVVSKMVVLV